MAHKKPKNPHSPSFEPTIALGNGRTAPRCQARSKRTGEQCRQPARKGFNVCHMHGAGTRKREQAGTAKPPGRPLETGLYSTRVLKTLPELLADVRALELPLDDTDFEMTVLRALLWRAVSLEPDVTAVKEALEGATFDDPLEMMEAARLLSRLSRYCDSLTEATGHYVRMVKVRAETDAKRAESKMLERFVANVERVKEIMQESLDYTTYQAISERLQREVLAREGVRMEA